MEKIISTVLESLSGESNGQISLTNLLKQTKLFNSFVSNFFADLPAAITTEIKAPKIALNRKTSVKKLKNAVQVDYDLNPKVAPLVRKLLQKLTTLIQSATISHQHLEPSNNGNKSTLLTVIECYTLLSLCAFQLLLHYSNSEPTVNSTNNSKCIINILKLLQDYRKHDYSFTFFYLLQSSLEPSSPPNVKKRSNIFDEAQNPQSSSLTGKLKLAFDPALLELQNPLDHELALYYYYFLLKELDIDSHEYQLDDLVNAVNAYTLSSVEKLERLKDSKNKVEKLKGLIFGVLFRMINGLDKSQTVPHTSIINLKKVALKFYNIQNDNKEKFADVILNWGSNYEKHEKRLDPLVDFYATSAELIENERIVSAYVSVYQLYRKSDLSRSENSHSEEIEKRFADFLTSRSTSTNSLTVMLECIRGYSFIGTQEKIIQQLRLRLESLISSADKSSYTSDMQNVFFKSLLNLLQARNFEILQSGLRFVKDFEFGGELRETIRLGYTSFSMLKQLESDNMQHDPLTTSISNDILEIIDSICEHLSSSQPSNDDKLLEFLRYGSGTYYNMGVKHLKLYQRTASTKKTKTPLDKNSNTKSLLLQKCVDFYTRSCDILKNTKVDELVSRYEALAAMQTEIGKYEQAMQTLQTSVLHIPMKVFQSITGFVTCPDLFKSETKVEELNRLGRPWIRDEKAFSLRRAKSMILPANQKNFTLDKLEKQFKVMTLEDERTEDEPKDAESEQTLILQRILKRYVSCWIKYLDEADQSDVSYKPLSSVVKEKIKDANATADDLPDDEIANIITSVTRLEFIIFRIVNDRKRVDTDKIGQTLREILEIANQPSVSNLQQGMNKLDFVGMLRESGEYATALKICKEAVRMLEIEIQTNPFSASLSDELAYSYFLNGLCLLDQSRTADTTNDSINKYEEVKMAIIKFKSAMKCWKSVVKLWREEKGEAWVFQRSVHCIYTLSDIMDMLQLPLNRIIFLRLAVDLLIKKKKNVYLDLIWLYTEIAYSYVVLGYTGKSGMYFAMGKSILDECQRLQSNLPGLSLVKLKWMLGYSYYLTAIGNVKKARSTMDDTREINASSSSDEDVNLIIPANLDRSVMASFAFFVEASIFRRIGKISDSVRSSLTSLKHLQVAVAAVRLGYGKGGFDESLFKELTILEIQSWLGQIFQTQGSFAESEHFFRQGVMISEISSSPIYCGNFLGGLAGLECRKYKLNDGWKDILEAADKFEGMKSEVSKKDSISSLLYMGDYQMRACKYDDALETLMSAEAKLDAAMNKTEIVKLDEVIDEAMATPVRREVTDEKLTNAPRKKKSMRKLPISKAKKLELPIAQTAASANNFLEGHGAKRDSKSSAQYECHILSDMKAEIVSRIGATLNFMDNLDEGEKRLIEGQEFIQRGIEQAEYYATLAAVKLAKLLKTFRSSMEFELFKDSALTFPWGLPQTGILGKQLSESTTALGQTQKHNQVAKQEKSKNTQPSFYKSAVHVEKLLEEAIKNIAVYGSTARFHEVCHQLLYVRMLRIFLGGCGTENLGDMLAWTSALFLEIPKGQTARREMKAIRTSPNLLEWPATKHGEEEDQTDFFEFYNNDERLEDETETDQVAFATGKLEEFINKIPNTWLVCSMSIDTKRNDLYITRYNTQQKTLDGEGKGKPIVMRIPLLRQSTREGDREAEFSFEDALKELSEIKEESANSMKITGADENGKKKTLTAEEKRTWWEKRKKLDVRMGNLLQRIDTCWLGGFKGMLFPDNEEISDATLDRFRVALEGLMTRALRPNRKIVRRKPGNATETRANAAPIPLQMPSLDKEFLRMIVRAGFDVTIEEAEDVVHYMLDIMRMHGIVVDFDLFNFDSLVDEYLKILKSFAVKQRQPKPMHLILILDRNLHVVPWESIPSLRNISVSRLPSLGFLSSRMEICENNDQQLACLKVDREKTAYVLNPSGDLSNTQKMFEDTLKKNPWKGSVGSAPEEQEYADMLQNNDVFLYFGHQGGEKYIGGHKIRKLDSCAVTLLMGCSSGHLNVSGEFDASGTPLHYLIGGSAAVVANLWDVTDKDIDKFTKNLLENWGLLSKDKQDSCDIVEAVMKSRAECTLKYLNGAAPVVYGVPVEIL
ncbi:hypothetical protein HK098_001213 [Nowakowskiella sp. JEL0407]|nr:hypothetical protein HK098_001213 [Nowakowskiella sp. JEL0407]